MYDMSYDIQFNYNSKKYQLQLLDSVEIMSDVTLLVDTAVIVLPEAVLNKVLDITSKIGRGAEVVIKLGYNGVLNPEFIGYVTDVTTNNQALKINCEDALFLFRKQVADEQLISTSVSKICQKLIDQIDPSFTLVCDYDISYAKFTIQKATAYDVLKKLQEETKANVFFDTEKKELHVHFPFKEKGGEVKYAMDMNIESSSLEYKKAEDRKVQVIVESVNSNGKSTEYKSGDTGGETVNIKASNLSQDDMKKLADAELIKRSADGYDGSFDAWLLPICKPTYTCKLQDKDYPDKDGSYYVKSVKTTFSSSGGKRTINLGIKL